MVLTPPPVDRVMNVFSVTFNQLKKRIVQQRYKKVIYGNTKRNPREFMEENVAFATST